MRRLSVNVFLAFAAILSLAIGVMLYHGLEQVNDIPSVTKDRDRPNGPNGRGRGGGGDVIPPPPDTIILAASCQYADVAAAIVVAASGNTVAIPAGDCTWTSQLSIAKDIVLKGSGIGQTIIRDGIQTAQAMLVWATVIGKPHRMTGIEFRDGGRPTLQTEGIVRLDCTNVGGTTFRVDHVKFNLLNGWNLRTNNCIGVIDHNAFETANRKFALYVMNPNWNIATTDHVTNAPGLDRWGDRSWSETVTWGGPDFLFVENNTFTSGSCVDGFRGTRAVFRYNTFTDCHITVHGTESSGRNRGSVAVEISKNTFLGVTAPDDIMAAIRSGSALIWGNTATGLIGVPKAARLTQYRAAHAFGAFGGADATNPWDINDTVAAGPFSVTSVCTANVACKLTATVSGAGWETDQWIGYTIRKLGCSVPNEANCFSVVQANTADTISYANSNTFGANLVFTVGSMLEFRRVRQVFDGVGRIGGSVLSGGTSSTPPPRPAMWNDQKTFPLYQWDNAGITLGFGTDPSCTGTCREGEHYINGSLPGYVPYQYPHPLAK